MRYARQPWRLGERGDDGGPGRSTPTKASVRPEASTAADSVRARGSKVSFRRADPTRLVGPRPRHVPFRRPQGHLRSLRPGMASRPREAHLRAPRRDREKRRTDPPLPPHDERRSLRPLEAPRSGAARPLRGGVPALLFFALQGPLSTRRRRRRARRTVKVTEYQLDFDNIWLFVALVALGSLLAMELVDKINYRDELELARDLQASLIPRELPAQRPAGSPAPTTGSRTRSAETSTTSWPLADGRLAVLFGDASGHGMAAGLVMAVAHAAFRTQLDVDASPEAMFATLNRILCRTGGPRAFFGCVYLVLSPDGTFAARSPDIPRSSSSGARRRSRPARPGRLPSRNQGATRVAARAAADSSPARRFSSTPTECRRRGMQGRREYGDERVEAVARSAGGLSAASLVGVLSAELRTSAGTKFRRTTCRSRRSDGPSRGGWWRSAEMPLPPPAGEGGGEGRPSSPQTSGSLHRTRIPR